MEADPQSSYKDFVSVEVFVLIIQCEAFANRVLTCSGASGSAIIEVRVESVGFSRATNEFMLLVV